MTTRWFHWGKISFLIRAVDPDFIFSLDEKRKKGELNDEGMRKEIFRFVLLKWRGLDTGPFRQEKDEEALFQDREIQGFVLQMSVDLLEEELQGWKRAYTVVEKRLLKSGGLKF
jgi:hypothetical protein